MNCRVCRQLLDAYIDGELSGSKRKDVEGHINECMACRREVEFLRELSRDTARLPKKIQPEKDLWPGIEAGMDATHSLKSPEPSGESSDLERTGSRRRTAAWGWPVAAAAMFGLILWAGIYLGFREQTTGDSNAEVIATVPLSEQSDTEASPSSRSLDTPLDTTVDRALGSTDSQIVSQFIAQPIDLFTDVFVSNYGIYAVRRTRNPSTFEVTRNFILNFNQNSEQSWIPPLPSGSTLLSVYPGEGYRLWVSYEIQEPVFQSVIAELAFGVDSQIRNIWTSDAYHVSGFTIGPQGWIYAAGYRNDFNKTVAKLTKGQSISLELVHLIDASTGEVRNLLPFTLHPDFNFDLWIGQTVREITSLSNHIAVAVKSNGNFFITTDRTSTLASVRGLINNEAIEYTPNGTIVRTWDLGSFEPDAYLNRIFVDVDDSILAEIIRYPEMDTAEQLDRTMIKRYFLRVDPDGKVTRYEPDFDLNEVIRGWFGQTQDLITVIDNGWMRQIGSHKLPH